MDGRSRNSAPLVSGNLELQRSYWTLLPWIYSRILRIRGLKSDEEDRISSCRNSLNYDRHTLLPATTCVAPTPVMNGHVPRKRYTWVESDEPNWTFKSLTWERWAESFSFRTCRLGSIREKTHITSRSNTVIACGVENCNPHQTKLVQTKNVNNCKTMRVFYHIPWRTLHIVSSCKRRWAAPHWNSTKWR